MHRLFRSAARIAALTVVIVGGGTVAAVPPAIADIGADMRLVCSGESGTYKLGLRIETTAPSSGTVGQPIQLGTVKIDVGVPAELVTKVQAGSPGGPSASPVTSVMPSSIAPPALSGVAEMQVAVRTPDRIQDSGWPAFALAAAPPNGDAIVHLTGSGVAPPVTPNSVGELSWSAGELGLSLVSAGTTTGKGGTESALHCVAEKEAVLGTVRVGPANEAPTPSSLGEPPRQSTAAQANLCESLPKPGVDPRYAINHEDPELEKIYKSPAVPTNLRPTFREGVPYCIKGVGFINTKKVGNAVPVAVESSAQFVTETYQGNPVLGPNYREFRGYAVNRTYPTPATVLGFGFMPTRAVAEAVQVGPPGSGEGDPITANLRLIQKLFPDHTLPGIGPDQIGASSYVRVKATKAQVNGVSLDLGNQCMTSPTAFTGKAFLGNWRTGMMAWDQGQTLVVNDLRIPSFSGCGVTEDLSPILTASVSGSGNYAGLETGHWCSVGPGTNCENGAGPQPPTFTVDPGGHTTATARPFVLTRDSSSPEAAQFKCESAAMRFDMDGAHWQSRFGLAKGEVSLEGCKVKASDGTEYPVVKTTQEGSVWLSVFLFQTDPMELQVTGIMLDAGVDVDGNGTADCSIKINRPRQGSALNAQLSGTPGQIQGPYDNGVLSMKYNQLGVAPGSTCAIPGFARADNRELLNFADLEESKFVFSPAQRITWDTKH
ncbi:hypothetical protein [Actinomadura sp. GTD37]|uniref:hypothetical protein n=1 Tax=Actinomadura sp. GTD37 TaxID=1778030 RepID=UPI0035BF626F